MLFFEMHFDKVILLYTKSLIFKKSFSLAHVNDTYSFGLYLVALHVRQTKPLGMVCQIFILRARLSLNSSHSLKIPARK